MIKLISNNRSHLTTYDLIGEDIWVSDIPELEVYVESVEGYQLDTETNWFLNAPIASHTASELYVIQIGDKFTQFIIDWPSLTESQKQRVVKILNDKSKRKYLHNAMFDYCVLAKHLHIYIDNIFDTFIQSKLLNSGLKTEENSLAARVFKYFGYEMSKDERANFNGTLTLEGIRYAAYDVVFLQDLHEKQDKEIDKWGLRNTYNLERNAVRPIGDVIINGMNFNADDWLIASKKAQKVLDQNIEAMDNMIESDPDWYHYMESHGLIQKNSEYLFNFRSSVQRRRFLNLEHPDLESCNQKVLKNLNTPIAQWLLNQEYDALQMHLIRHHHEKLEEWGIFVPKGTKHYMWSSNDNCLTIFKYKIPKLEAVNKDALADHMNVPIIREYSSFTKNAKTVSSYGESYLDNIEEDGKCRPKSITQILETGRMSMQAFIGGGLQTIPSKGENVILRHAYKAGEGRSFVIVDYSSCELIIMAYGSGEQSWIDAIQNGWDLHSLNAAMAFKEEWDATAEPDCNFAKNKQACSCKRHKELRQHSKSVSFGLAYGQGPGGLAENTGMSMSDARDLIFNKFFPAVPKLHKWLEQNGHLAKTRLWSETLPPFRRKRFYPQPRNGGEEGSIERAGKNSPQL